MSISDLIKKAKENKKFVMDTSFISSLRFLQIILQLAITYFLVRAISQEDYGNYQFILSVVATLAVFSLPGVHNATMQSTARGFMGTYLKAIPISFYTSFIASVVLIGFACWFWYQGQMNVFTGFMISAAMFPFYHGLRQWRGLYTGQEKFQAHFVFNSVSTIVMALSMIAAMQVFPENLVAPLFFLLFIPVLQNLYITYVSAKNIPKDSEVEAGIIKYGVQTSFYMSVTIFANNIERLLLFTTLTPVALAVFVVANRLADIFQNLNQDLAVVIAPRFAKQDYYTKEIDSYIKIFVFLYGLAIFIFAFTVLPWIFPIIFGEQYNSSISYAQILLCLVCFGNMATIRFRFIRSRVDSKGHRKVVLTSSFIRIFSALIFVPWLGINGAIASMIIYKVVNMIMVSVAIKAHYPPEEKIDA